MLYPSLVLTATVSALFVGGATTIREPLLSNTVVTAESLDSISNLPRLSIKPRDAATGTKTEMPGTRELPGFPGYYLHVPEQCVGNKRVPLVLLLHGGGRSGAIEIEKFRVLADKYGMIVLAGNATVPGRWDVISGVINSRTKYSGTENGLTVTEFPETDVRVLDSALKYVLRTHAIDPAKIALLGFSDGGSYSLFLGRANMDVFSRIAPLSAMMPLFADGGPANDDVQFFLSGGMEEQGVPLQTIKLAQVLRKNGHAVVTQIGLRGHVDNVSDEDFVWAWLKDSWANPDVTKKPITIKPDPILTEDGLGRLAAFWSTFKTLPDSITGKGRLANLIHIPIQLGTETVWTALMNLPVLAKKYPPVADALKTSGITAEDAQAYRTAIIGVLNAKRVGLLPGEQVPEIAYGKSIPLAPIAASSIMARNSEFLDANKLKFDELKESGFLRVR